jgi:hypothetical protein
MRIRKNRENGGCKRLEDDDEKFDSVQTKPIGPSKQHSLDVGRATKVLDTAEAVSKFYGKGYGWDVKRHLSLLLVSAETPWRKHETSWVVRLREGETYFGQEREKCALRVVRLQHQFVLDEGLMCKPRIDSWQIKMVVLVVDETSLR